MIMDSTKVMSLSEAISKYLFNGAHLSIGGFTINRNPMAAVHEIIRQKIKNLHLYAHSNGQGVDELIGAGCISKIEIAYGGGGRFAPTCIRFRKAIQEGSVLVEDYTNYQMTLRFLAGAMGVPFLPCRSSLGSDIVQKWGFSKELRFKDDKIPDKKLMITDNPFNKSESNDKIVLVPAITPDVTLVHVQQCDTQGTVRIKGLPFADVDQAKSAKHLIVTCEELVEPSLLRKNPDQNQIPFFIVDAVVHIPMGAHPTGCYQFYDYDPFFLKQYERYAKDDALYNEYLKKFIFGTFDHHQFLELLGKEQLSKIKADPRTGYAVGLDRR